MRTEDRPDIRTTGTERALRPTPAPSRFFQRHVWLQWVFLASLLGLLTAGAGAAFADEGADVTLLAQAEDATAAAEDDYEYADEDDDYEYAEDEEDYDYAEEDEESDYAVDDELADPADEDVPDYSGVEEIRIEGAASQGIDVGDAQSAVQFDMDDLEALGATDISDIAKVTPNLQITQSGATTANFFIRGVGLADFSANSASAVSVYQDGMPLNASTLQLVGLFDVQNLAVLRGPQGYSSNRNASAGAIKIESRRPTGDFNAQLRSVFGSYWTDDADDAFIQQYDGSFETPIMEDLLSTRIAFTVQKADPYQENGCGEGIADFTQLRPCGRFVVSVPNIPRGLPAKVGNEGRWAARGLFRLQPDVLDMDWLLSVSGSRLDQQSTLGQASGTIPTLGRRTGGNYFEPDQLEEFQTLRRSGLSTQLTQAVLAQNLASGRPLDIRPYRGDYNRVGQTKLDTWATTLDGTMVFEDTPFLGPVEFQTITGGAGYDRLRDQDLDNTPSVLFEWAPATDRAWQIFQELKASGEDDDGVFRWETGGYYLMEELDASINQRTVNAAFDFLRFYDQQLWSFAFHGSFVWDFLDDFTLEAGARYNWERKTFNFSQRQGLVFRVAPTQGETWTAPTGGIQLTYRFFEDVSSYFKYSRGWKGGHFNANRPSQPPARPETIDSIEAGLNGSFFDSRVRLAFSVFYYKYKDYQLFLFEPAVASPPLLEIVNANDAEQYGVEIEMDAVPLQDWEFIPELWADMRVNFRFGWLESQFLDFVNEIEDLDSFNLPFQRPINYTGNRLPSAPPFKIAFTLEYPLNFGRFGVLTPRYDLAWTDDVFFGPNNGRGLDPAAGLPAFTTGQPAYALHDVRLAWADEDGVIEIAGWIRNIADQRYKRFAFDASIFASVVISTPAKPRTAGVDITFRF